MIEKIVLENGIRVMLEQMPYLRSVTAGVWIGAGSVNEDENSAGISHFIEHMLFKGTQKRSAMEIAAQMDMIGGQINAFTSKECTCYHVKVLDDEIDTALEILADMIKNSRLDEKDIETERGVIFEEIGMTEDTPDDLVVELLCEAVWDGSPLAGRILGSEKSVGKMAREDFMAYMKKMYVPQNMVISVAGGFDRGTVLDVIKEEFGSLCAPPRKEIKISAGYKKSFIVKEKEIEQNHICLGFPGAPSGTDDSLAFSVMSNILCGGMSSRLFQKIREELGLCYSIFSFCTGHKAAGIFSIYAGLSPNNQKEAIGLITDEIEIFRKHGPTYEELERGRNQIKANLLMSAEQTSSRMSSMGRGEIIHERVYTPDELIERINAVECKRIIELGREALDLNKMSLSVVGDIKDEYIP